MLRSSDLPLAEAQDILKHEWKCTDIPSYYICPCGAIGVWNWELEKIEVAQPMPYETYVRRHKVS